MKTIKVIDLLNKIANEKDYKKIKFIFNDDTYTWNERKHDYDSENTKHLETGILGYLGFSKYQLNRKIEIIEDKPKKWEIKDGRFVVDKVLEDGSVIIVEEDEKIEPISVYLDYLDFDLLFPAIFSKKFTHNELVIINKVNEMIKRLNKGE